MKRELNSTLSGNRDYYTAGSLLVVLKKSCSQLDCQQGFKSILFSYEVSLSAGRRGARRVPVTVVHKWPNHKWPNSLGPYDEISLEAYEFSGQGGSMARSAQQSSVVRGVPMRAGRRGAGHVSLGVVLKWPNSLGTYDNLYRSVQRFRGGLAFKAHRLCACPQGAGALDVYRG